MKNIIKEFKKISLKKTLPGSFYKREARATVRRYNLSDENFKYFFLEFIELTKSDVCLEAVRDTISRLQRTVTTRINREYDQNNLLEDIF